MKHKNIISAVLVLVLLMGTLAYMPMDAQASSTGKIEAVAIKLSMPAVDAADVSAVTATTSTGGCYISSLNWYDVYGRRMTNKFTNENATVEIVLTAAPGYDFADWVSVTIDGAAASFEHSESRLVVSKTYSPVIWAPNIVKHPGSEKVKEGGTASFVAYASCTNKSDWGIIDSDGNYCAADIIPERFPGTVVEISYEKLNIAGITRDMDGCKVLCNFTGPGGQVGTNFATITVEYEDAPASTPAPAATPEPTPVHEHVFSQELSMDAGFHWYECECGEMQFRAEHNYEWTQLSAATAESSGRIQGLCSICGYVMNAETMLDPAEIAAAEESPSSTPMPELPEETEKPGLFKRILSLIVPGM